jgi:dGTPase
MISLMIWDIAEEASRLIALHGIQTLNDVYNCKEKLVNFSPSMEAANKALKDFLTTRLYFHPEVVRHSEHGKKIIKKLFKHYMEEWKAAHPGEIASEGAVIVKDYLAGMTDRFAEIQAQELEEF